MHSGRRLKEMAEEGERAVFDQTGTKKVPVTLADLNTTKNESAQAQMLADLHSRRRESRGSGRYVAGTENQSHKKKL